REDNELVKFEDVVHCEIVNKDDEKRSSMEFVVCNIVNKNVKVVGVPSDQWQRVRTEYLQNRKNEGEDMPKQQAQQTEIAQKTK
ncbi:DNA polymerase III subunit gamma/tau, partial [Staphylococcus aureus]